jgi:hypothetical protein
MQLRYNYRVDPQPRHRIAFAKAFGCVRVVFNDGLAARQQAHAAGQPYITDGELSARLTAVKATPERAWLGEVSAVILQQALADLNRAYRNFFASVTGKRKGPKGSAAPVQVPQGPQAGDPVHRQRPVQGAPERSAAPPEDRGCAGPLVPPPAVRTVQRHRDQGCGGPVLRELRRPNRR